MGYFDDIRQQYGDEAVVNLKEIKNLRFKLNRLRNRRSFLLRCRSKKTFPSFIQQNVKCATRLLSKAAQFSKKADNIIFNFKKAMLNLEIAVVCSEISEAESQYSDLIKLIKSQIPENVWKQFLNVNNPYLKQNFNLIKKRQMMKFENLYKRQHFQKLGPENCVKNLSQKQIPEKVEQCLALGPKFAYEPSVKEYPVNRLLADVDFGIATLDEDRETKSTLKNEVIHTVNNFIKKNRMSTQSIPTEDLYKETRKFLKENSDLIVLNSDKGNVTCVIDRDSYKRKCDELVNDTNTYQVLDTDPTESIERKNNDLVRSLNQKKYITNQEKKSLTIYNSQPPRLYGNPKVHKINYPLRPIVSCVKSPTNNLSKFIDKTLKNITRWSAFNVKDSIDAADKLKDIEIPEGYILVSFDVISLFTNVKKEDAIKAITKNWDAISLHTDMPLDEFVKVVSFLFDSSYFKYNGKFYKQKSGCAMGDPASPTIANTVMEEVLQEFISKLNFLIPFLLLFVDDACTCVPENELENCIQVLNSINPNIQFTYEVEENGQLPFLDLLLVRVGNKIKIDHYRKPSNSKRILNFLSYHPIKQKLSIVKQIATKIIKVCSDVFVEGSLDKFRTLLKENNYPENLINNVFKEVKDKIKNNNNNYNRGRNRLNKNRTQNNTNNTKYIKAPFHHRLAPQLKRIFRNTKSKLTFYNTKSNSKFFGKVKDKIPDTEKSEVVYKLDCDCGHSYIGQTRQRVKKRIEQHKRDIKKFEGKTGLSKHIVDSQHKVNWDGVQILDTESNNYKRSFLEMYHITRNNKSLNIQGDFKNYNNTYNHVIKSAR